MHGAFIRTHFPSTSSMEALHPRRPSAPLTSVLHKPSDLLWDKCSSYSSSTVPGYNAHKKIALPSVQTLPTLTSLLKKHAYNFPISSCVGNSTRKRQRDFNDVDVSTYAHVDESSWELYKRRRNSPMSYSMLYQNYRHEDYPFERSTTTQSQEPHVFSGKKLTTSPVMGNLPEPSYSPTSSSPTSVSSKSIAAPESNFSCPSAVAFMEEYSPTQKGNIPKLPLQSKEFLQSTQLIRNRNNDIDWVATFLKVGFSDNSIYSLMCPLRKGRWKVEEEAYTMELLRCLERGELRLCHGQSIRSFIAKKLHSDDMRVLKKLSNCKAFHFARGIHPRMSDDNEYDFSLPTIDATIMKVDALKAEFLRSVQLEALVAVRKYLSDSSIRELPNSTNHH